MMAAAAIKEPVGMVKSSRSQSQLDERNKENTFSSEFLDDTNTSARKNKDTTLISALHNKYSTSSMKSMHCQIFLASNAPGKTASGNFRVPENLTLDMCQITSAGLRDDVARLCSGVRELDLAQNRIESWEEVWNILDLIPKLEFLNLTKNPLRQLTASCGRRKYERLRNWF
ncbi:hypothetical protein EB796_022541 [Bugula neritina]|uniref:TBCEL n=1 Tax=Bugula neritina TaxID=10212 RepID=A0A7J7J0F9_BUGNE|nr:hypothetical protein EB796_022541 [Bugula neritina]